MPLHSTVEEVTQRIIERSKTSRTAYLTRMNTARASSSLTRSSLSCGNLAHGFAACASSDKKALKGDRQANIAIVSAYNDMLSAHQPFVSFPDIIKDEARKSGAVAQFAGGVPAMCDGVTQGQPGMELSLFSRDLIAMSTAVALSHQMFDAVLCLGVCDKIVPGLLIGALSFGHLPVIFVPAGPMPSGMANFEKVKIRQQFARGEVGRDALLDAESKSYHSAGTCTFYGTANTNQMLMEFMGLHLPGAAFPNPKTPLREALTRAATNRVAQLAQTRTSPLFEVIDEKAIVNGLVGLLSSGGSTNLTIHLITMARAAGICINWDDFSDLAAVVPLLCRIYPNGMADINHFHAAGGVGFLMRELLHAGFLHPNVTTVAGEGLTHYTREPFLNDQGIVWKDCPETSLDPKVLAPFNQPFSADGGLKLLKGNLGRAVIKISAVKPEHRRVEAPAVVFDDQNHFLEAFNAGELEKDLVAVIRYQGPSANGMPELHKLSPSLGILQDKGFKVALITDGRMSGASGKFPAAIHITPECLQGGPLGLVRNGDLIFLDADRGVLKVLVDEDEWGKRESDHPNLRGNEQGTGRELFSSFRGSVSSAEEGATVFGGMF